MKHIKKFNEELTSDDTKLGGQEKINDEENTVISVNLKNIKKFNENKKTLIISAFPGTGKTYLFNNTDKTILDSDSSKFDKTKFPENYIQHIKDNIGKVDIILVSSHKPVRDALVANKIDFTLVYPSKELKEEYINRYKQRGSPETFIDLITKNWENWIDELSNQIGCTKCELSKGEYLKDII